MKNKINKIYIILIAVLLIDAGTIGYFVYQNLQLKEFKLALETELSQVKADFALTTKNLNSVIDALSEELGMTKSERDDFAQKYTDEKNRMDTLASQISGIQGTVGDLEKLSQTDPELLKKYSKVYFLNENYIPKNFMKITPSYTYYPQKDLLFLLKTWPFLEDLMSNASSSGIDLKITSAYRSFGTQAEIKATHLIIYGSGANQFSADQGYSEHQLGTTLDFTTSKMGATHTGFEKTATYQWLLDNAYKYGFILSYPENNSYYQFEPWHWRFVGKALATKLYQEGKYFYDLDQREINEYLISFFE